MIATPLSTFQDNTGLQLLVDANEHRAYESEQQSASLLSDGEDDSKGGRPILGEMMESSDTDSFLTTTNVTYREFMTIDDLLEEKLYQNWNVVMWSEEDICNIRLMICFACGCWF